MVADIVPVLAAITGLDQDVADAVFATAWTECKQANNGRADTKTFTDAVMAFRAAYPFNLSDLNSAWRARDELEGPPHYNYTKTLPVAQW
jgi:hypothetical protein